MGGACSTRADRWDIRTRIKSENVKEKRLGRIRRGWEGTSEADRVTH
jgi:hypothetical protein